MASIDCSDESLRNSKNFDNETKIEIVLGSKSGPHTEHIYEKTEAKKSRTGVLLNWLKIVSKCGTPDF
jgi:hypothetical protein